MTYLQPSLLQTLDELEWIIAPVLFTFLAFFTRLYKIGISNIVTWDEAQYVAPGSVAAIGIVSNLGLRQLRKIRLPLLEARILL